MSLCYLRCWLSILGATADTQCTHSHIHTHVIHLYKCLADNLSRALPFAAISSYVCMKRTSEDPRRSRSLLFGATDSWQEFKVAVAAADALLAGFLVYFSGYFSHCYQIEWKHILIERKFTSNLVRRHPTRTLPLCHTDLVRLRSARFSRQSSILCCCCCCCHLPVDLSVNVGKLVKGFARKFFYAKSWSTSCKVFAK